MKIFVEKIKNLIGKIKIFTEKIVTKIIKKIMKKLPESLPAGLYSTVQETGQIPDCGFYVHRNSTLFSGAVGHVVQEEYYAIHMHHTVAELVQRSRTKRNGLSNSWSMQSLIPPAKFKVDTNHKHRGCSTQTNLRLIRPLVTSLPNLGCMQSPTGNPDGASVRAVGPS